MEAIRTEALTKHYRVGFWRPRPYVALDALTLEVREGEVFGFLGPNGAGKTTTLKLLMQLIYPTSGRAEILGRPVGDIEVRRRIGYLPENPYFYDYLTAEELLEYFASLFGYGHIFNGHIDSSGHVPQLNGPGTLSRYARTLQRRSRR